MLKTINGYNWPIIGTVLKLNVFVFFCVLGNFHFGWIKYLSRWSFYSLKKSNAKKSWVDQNCLVECIIFFIYFCSVNRSPHCNSLFACLLFWDFTQFCLCSDYRECPKHGHACLWARILANKSKRKIRRLF